MVFKIFLNIGHFVSFQCRICKPWPRTPGLASKSPKPGVKKRGHGMESLITYANWCSYIEGLNNSDCASIEGLHWNHCLSVKYTSILKLFPQFSSKVLNLCTNNFAAESCWSEILHCRVFSCECEKYNFFAKCSCFWPPLRESGQVGG